MQILGSSLLFWASLALIVKLFYLFIMRKNIKCLPYERKFMLFSVLVVVSLMFIWALVDALLTKIF